MGKLEDHVRRETKRLIQQSDSAPDEDEKARLLQHAQDMLAGLHSLKQPPQPPR